MFTSMGPGRVVGALLVALLLMSWPMSWPGAGALDALKRKDSEDALQLVHDVSTGSLGSLCLADQHFRSLSAAVDPRRYDPVRQKADMAALVLKDLGVAHHNGLLDAVTKALLLSERHLLAARILTLNASTGDVLNMVEWKYEGEGLSMSGPSRSHPASLPADPADLPWYEDAATSPTLRSPKFVDSPANVSYKGWWTFPYFSCSARRWLLSYSVPVAPTNRHTTKGFLSLDVDLSSLEVNQCEPSPRLAGWARRAAAEQSQVAAFHGTHKCDNVTTQCVHIPGAGWARGSYLCRCRPGFYSPKSKGIFNGTVVEREGVAGVRGATDPGGAAAGAPAAPAPLPVPVPQVRAGLRDVPGPRPLPRQLQLALQNQPAGGVRVLRGHGAGAGGLRLPQPPRQSLQGGLPHLPGHHAAGLRHDVPRAGRHLPRAGHVLVHRHQVGAPPGLLHHLHRPADEDVEGVADVPRQVRAQGQADGQAAAAVDVPHPAGHAHLPGRVDAEHAAAGRGDPRLGGARLQAVPVQLVGPQPVHRGGAVPAVGHQGLLQRAQRRVPVQRGAPHQLRHLQHRHRQHHHGRLPPLHLSARRAGHQVPAGLHPHAAQHLGDRGARLRAQGGARAARPGRPVGQPRACQGRHGLLLAQRHRPGARGDGRPLPGERGAQGGDSEAGGSDRVLQDRGHGGAQPPPQAQSGRLLQPGHGDAAVAARGRGWRCRHPHRRRLFSAAARHPRRRQQRRPLPRPQLHGGRVAGLQHLAGRLGGPGQRGRRGREAGPGVTRSQ